jgi:hypothetical protein
MWNLEIRLPPSIIEYAGDEREAIISGIAETIGFSASDLPDFCQFILSVVSKNGPFFYPLIRKISDEKGRPKWLWFEGFNSVIQVPYSILNTEDPIQVIRWREYRRTQPRTPLFISPDLNPEIIAKKDKPGKRRVVNLSYGGACWCSGGPSGDFAEKNISLDSRDWKAARSPTTHGHQVQTSVLINNKRPIYDRWIEQVQYHLYAPFSTTAPAQSNKVWAVLVERYFQSWLKPKPNETAEEKQQRQQVLERLYHSFMTVAFIIHGPPSIGHNVVLTLDGKPAATIAFCRIFSKTMMGHQIGTTDVIKGSLEKRNFALRESSFCGFELAELQKDVKYIAGYCTDQGKWLNHYRNFANKLARQNKALNHEMQLVGIPTTPTGPGLLENRMFRRSYRSRNKAIIVRKTEKTEDVKKLLDILRTRGSRTYRKRIYRETLDLNEADFFLKQPQKRLENARTYALTDPLLKPYEELLGQTLERTLYLAELTGEPKPREPVAAAVVDTTLMGLNVLGLFDCVHIWPLRKDIPHNIEEFAYAVLLDVVMLKFESLNKHQFNYILEQETLAPGEHLKSKDLPSHVLKLKKWHNSVLDIENHGGGFFWVIRRDVTQDFLNHMWLHAPVSIFHNFKH